MLDYESYYLVTDDFPASSTTKSSRLAAHIVFCDELNVGEAGYITAPPNAPQRREFLVTESKDPDFEPHWITIADDDHLTVGTGAVPVDVTGINLDEKAMVIRHIAAEDIVVETDALAAQIPNGLLPVIRRMAGVGKVTTGLIGIAQTDHATLINLISPRQDGGYRSQFLRIDKGSVDVTTVSEEFIYSKPMVLGKGTLYHIELLPALDVHGEIFAGQLMQSHTTTPTEEPSVKDNEPKRVEADLIADIAAIRQALRQTNRWIPRTGMFVVVDQGIEPWVIVDYDAYDKVFYLERADSARRQRDQEECDHGRGFGHGRRPHSHEDREHEGAKRFSQSRVSPFYLEG